MLRVERIRSIDSDGNAVMDIQVSTVEELPALGEPIDGVTDKNVGKGSIAQVVQIGAWCTLDADGTWYDTDGKAAGSDGETSNSLNAISQSPAVIDRSALLGGGKSILAPDADATDSVIFDTFSADEDTDAEGVEMNADMPENDPQEVTE